jgi:DNA-binding response OmpR family regulator
MSNVVDSAISSLRKKIGGPNPEPLIHTRHGVGYILKAPA